MSQATNVDSLICSVRCECLFEFYTRCQRAILAELVGSLNCVNATQINNNSSVNFNYTLTVQCAHKHGLRPVFEWHIKSNVIVES